MNRTLATLILTATATLGVTSLQAQSREVADIPFPFHIQAQAMPAGRYEVKQFNGHSSSLFSITDYNSHSRFVGTTTQTQADPANPRLTFACRNGACFLSTISLPGSEVAHGMKLHDTNVRLGLATEIAIKISH